MPDPSDAEAAPSVFGQPGSGRGEGAHSRRILTVPNLISVGRLVVLTPLFAWLLLGLQQPMWALLVVVVLGSTDWVDGFIARRFDQVSELGKALDPFADRLSQFVVCLSLVIAGLVPVWMVVVIVLADLMLGLSVVITRPGIVPVKWIGRIRTVILMVGLPLVLAVEAFAPGVPWLHIAALLFVGIGVVLHGIANTWYTVELLAQARRKRDVGGPV